MRRTRPTPRPRPAVEPSIAGSAPVPPEPLRRGTDWGPGRVPEDPAVFPHLFLHRAEELKIGAGAAFVVKLQ